MDLQNPFPQRVRLLYLYVYACFGCGRSDQGLELHHVFGRESAAAFNACPLCKECHAAIVHNDAEHERYFFINVQFLLSERYRPQEDDFDILRAHPFLIQSERYQQIFVDKSY